MEKTDGTKRFESYGASDDDIGLAVAQTMSNPGETELQFCSACRGDYEDPDASAGDESVAAGDDGDDGESMSEEFPG